MKKLLISICLVFLLAFPAGATNYCNDANIVICQTMKIDENPINDISANNYDGTLLSAGNPDYATDAPSDYDSGSYVFTSDYINFGDNDAFSSHAGASGKMTVVMWIKFTSLRTNSSWPPNWILGKGGSSNYEFGFGQYGYTTGEARVMLSFWQTGSASVASIDNTNTTLSTATWYHLAFTFDRANSIMKIYLNGSEDGSTTSFTGNTGNGDRALIIGAREYEYGGSLPATVTEFGLFSRVLTQTEIQDIMDHGLDGSQGSVATATFLADDMGGIF